MNFVRETISDPIILSLDHGHGNDLRPVIRKIYVEFWDYIIYY